jgi:hypothetical protein
MKPTKNKKPELTPAQAFGQSILRSEYVADAIGVCLLLLALGLYYLGVNEMAMPEKSFSPFLAHIIPALEDTDQITVCAGQLMAGAVLVLVGLMIIFRTRLNRLN